ncbi:TonB-dependent receptor domain-containing protein [Brevundimonas basaltis]|uniref:Outer membrane receptor protein involved in Fe transport n=1 Tax=Brevundimonas basaltis TaxID=472166 RepID=A0A7W8MIC9_9CAUL|nr:TonB-dependent receptor [Brevundimonas basaltis]MBB5292891.1 outer membrane receptor protein involved in Fe transport [Brevundimonas basaltis]
MLLKRKFLFGTTILAGVMAAAAPALAQSTQVPGVTVTGQQGQEATEIEEVVVTGSRIRRDPVNSPTPLIQVEREDLLSTGQATVIDYLATIPALSNSLVPSDTTGSNLNDGGLEFANLRSLGSGRTLTLIDGRRHVGSQAGTLQVDVSTIPRLLIQNIEIITGGASSVYGADAVSGVLNYILRKDFEGLEIDANWGQLVQGGEADTRRISVLAGANLLDDRLNIYAHGEYERAEEVYSEHIDWLRRGRVALGIDADPTQASLGPVNDGFIDVAEFYGARRLDRPQWGSTTLANMQRPSRLSDPDVPFANCSGLSTSSACFNVDPAYTYWYDGPTARLANFGQRIGNTGTNRPWNIGGDGEPANLTAFNNRSQFPFQESERYQTGLTFQLTDNIEFYGEAKYTTEDTFDVGQFSFWDIFITDAGFGGGINSGSFVGPGLINGTSQFSTRTDNAFLPANVATAIQNNTFVRYGPATANADGPVLNPAQSGPIANHRGFGIERNQTNNREITRFVAGLEGNWDRVGFIDNVNWTLSYVHGEMNNVNREQGPDAIRFGHAMDSVVDLAGEVNGRPGEIVCRVQLLNARGITIREQNPNTATTVYTDPNTNPEIAGCVPLNVFGKGNQSPEAIEYITAAIRVRETNEQESAVAAISGQLWDFWGAGPLGLAVGAEYRREHTQGIGRSADTAGRVLQLNTGADFLPAEYESEEWFAEMSLPLLRDSWMGEYAELSASYRAFDYTTAGEGDVYGVNLVYRPIRDITFKTSFNTSFRAPTLQEGFRPFSQTFVNGFVDPCHTGVIANFQGDDAAQTKANRIANCTQLAAAKGLAFDFGSTTVTQADDYRPVYGSGIASVLGGNTNLNPEESESFTFSTAIAPRMFPNLSLVLDYYEITVNNVIITPGGQFLADDCVSNAQLNTQTCGLVFRNNPTTGDPFDNFKVGAPAGDPIGGFILGPINRSKLETRGLDFTVNYSLDTEEAFGRNWGRFSYSLGGLWLIDQKNFTNPADPNAFTDSTSGVFFPRVEFVSRLTWRPNDVLAMTWTADWMSSQDLNKNRDLVATGNLDNQPYDWNRTGNFTRHDFAVRYDLRDDLTLRANVTNVFDTEAPPFLGFASTFDPYGRRFNVGLNYRPF